MTLALLLAAVVAAQPTAAVADGGPRRFALAVGSCSMWHWEPPLVTT